ncbi:Copper Transporter integral membrane protein that functions in high affinity copper transport [Saccharomyces pastorianus]|uniref:Copper Transporter integral membrane protein that functions in high affinity copper transport n=1 Tax=Saccharomyces pastorianus TaxID=27292 RepID=A0A6C1ECI1_SACPS|nr:Copper Transporter integral membrane protein that functions in high affinity copper transport [Saccharomyces pastorianus]
MAYSFSRQFDVELLRRQKIKHLANYSPEEYVVKCGDEDAKSDMEELQGFHNEASWKTTLIALQRVLSTVLRLGPKRIK